MKNAGPRDVVRTLAGALLLAVLSACGGGGDASTGGAPAAVGTDGDTPMLGAADGPTGRGDETPVVVATGSSTSDATGGSTDSSTDRPATAPTDEPIGGVTGGPVERPASGTAGASPDEVDGPGDAAVETVDDAFDLALVSVDAKRRSTGERIPIEIVGVSSGELRFVSSEP